MKKKWSIIICVLLFLLLCIIFVYSRVFFLRMTYEIDGQSIDYSQAGPLTLDGFDGVESCWGYGINLTNQKLFVGIDFDGLSQFTIEDGCSVNGKRVWLSYKLEFPKRTLHRFYSETVHVRLKQDGEGKVQGKIIHNNNLEEEMGFVEGFPRPEIITAGCYIKFQ